MNIECPQCGSTEFTKLSLVYAQGFSDLKARSRGWGLSIGSVGADLGFARAKTSGRLQSKLSQAVAPPRKWSIWRLFFWSLVAIPCLEFGLALAGSGPGSTGQFNEQLPWVAAGYLAVIAAVLLIALRHNYGIVPARRRVWERSFMCRRCGHTLEVFDLGGSAEAGSLPNMKREALR